jgi:hypothetical protein
VNRPLFPLDTEPLEVVHDPLLRVGIRAGGVGVVDAQDHYAPLFIRKDPVGDRGQRAPEVQRAGRARCEANAGHGYSNVKRVAVLG